MKILFLTHHSFVDQKENQKWLTELKAQMEEKGAEVHFFSPEKHHIYDFKLIHLFGFGHFELSWNLRQSGATIFCTPGLNSCPERSLTAKILEKLLISFHFLKQKRFPPIDIFLMIRSIDLFILNSAAAHSWRKNWGLKNTNDFELHSKNFAEELFQIYTDHHIQ